MTGIVYTPRARPAFKRCVHQAMPSKILLEKCINALPYLSHAVTIALRTWSLPSRIDTEFKRSMEFKKERDADKKEESLAQIYANHPRGIYTNDRKFAPLQAQLCFTVSQRHGDLTHR